MAGNNQLYMPAAPVQTAAESPWRCQLWNAPCEHTWASCPHLTLAKAALAHDGCAEGLACEQHTEQGGDAVDEEPTDIGWQGVSVLL